jgi:hypothetical protein
MPDPHGRQGGIDRLSWCAMLNLCAVAHDAISFDRPYRPLWEHA